MKNCNHALYFPWSFLGLKSVGFFGYKKIFIQLMPKPFKALKASVLRCCLFVLSFKTKLVNKLKFSCRQRKLSNAHQRGVKQKYMKNNNNIYLKASEINDFFLNPFSFFFLFQTFFKSPGFQLILFAINVTHTFGVVEKNLFF